MRLKVKNLPIGTGDIIIAVLCEQDATHMDLQPEDRILLQYKGKSIIATVDIIGKINGGRKNYKQTMLARGQIGLFLEAQYALGVNSGETIEISTAKKPVSLQYIKKKLEGKRLSSKELHILVQDIIKKNLSDVELAYFVAGSYLQHMDMAEVTALTLAMAHSGDILKLPKKIIVDKHCIGGVAANRTSMLIVPILAAAGLTIPKTSSRSITSAAGTADTVEVLCPIVFNLEKMKDIVMKTGGCLVWGGAMSLAPADDKIIQVEHPLSIDPTGQLLASIMAKKKSVSATHVLIDIPVGRGAKITDKDKAFELKSMFEELGRRLHIKVAVIMTDGSQPVGNGVGPSLEVRDVVWTLKNSSKGSLILKNKSIYMAGVLLELTGKAKKGQGEEIAREIVETGKAYQKFVEIIEAQGGTIKRPEDIRFAKKSKIIFAKKSGIITHIDNGTINKIARIAGAPHDKEAGVYLHYHKGAHVKKGDKLFTLYSDSQERLDYAIETINKIDGIEIR